MVFSVLQLRAENQLSHSLESNDLAGKETFEVKVPLNLPYPINSTGYERVEGTVKSGDRYFQLLKQKIENDTLTLVLVNDERSNHLEKVLYVLDEQQGNSSSSEGALTLTVKPVQEFISIAHSIINESSPWSREITHSEQQPLLVPEDIPGTPPPPRI